MSNNKSVIQKASDIIDNRSEEKQREYGPPVESFEKCAIIASVLCGKELTASDCCKVMLALKMSRLSHSYKEDTMVDSIAYLGILDLIDKPK